MAEPGAHAIIRSATIGGVLELYRASLAKCWPSALLVSLLWTGLLARVLLALDPQDDLMLLASQLQATLLAPSFEYSLLAVTALSILPYCAMVACVHASATGGAVVGAGLPVALRVFPGAVVAAVLFLTLTSIGTLAFIFPGVYLWGMWQLWIVAIVVERCGPLAALGRSWRLTRGSWWPAVTLVTIITILSTVALLVLDMMIGWIVALLGIGGTHALIATVLALGIAGLLILPLVPAALVAVYLSLGKVRLASAGGVG